MPYFLLDKRKHILWLQWLLAVAVGYLLYFSDPDPMFGTADGIIVGFIVINLLLFLVKPEYFYKPGLDYVLVLSDILFLSATIYFTRTATSEFYLFFFLVLILAASGENLKALMFGVFSVCLVYAWMVYRSQDFSMTSGFLLRVPFLFIVGLFFSHLVYLHKREKERMLVESAFTLELFELGDALARSSDPEILYRRIPRLIRSIMGADACEFVIVEDGQLVRRIFDGGSGLEIPQTSSGRSIHRKSLESEGICATMDFRQDASFRKTDDFSFFPYQVYMAKSFKSRGRPAQLLALYRKERVPWNEHELKKFQFIADQSALAIQYAHLLRELESQARSDGLTGLVNFLHFRERVEVELSRSSRKGYSFSILMLDIDHFKEVNDTLGHPVGNEILQRLAALLVKTTRRMDVAARVGGDEFAVLLPETNAAQAQVVCRRILDQLSRMHWNNVPRLSVSIGTATFPQDAANLDDLFVRVDQALYRAKAEGRGQACMYSGAAIPMPPEDPSTPSPPTPPE
ncbi:MAG: sensor domain-containing diguanylate cyclase [bacterium]